VLSVLSEMEQNMFTEAEHTIALRGVSTTLSSKGNHQSTKTSARSVKTQPHSHLNVQEHGTLGVKRTFLSVVFYKAESFSVTNSTYKRDAFQISSFHSPT